MLPWSKFYLKFMHFDNDCLHAGFLYVGEGFSTCFNEMNNLSNFISKFQFSGQSPC